MAMWALWAANEVERNALTVLNHRVAKPPAERDPKLAQAAIEALRAPFAVLDKDAGRVRLHGRRPLHRGRHQHRRGGPLRHGGAGAVRGRARG